MNPPLNNTKMLVFIVLTLSILKTSIKGIIREAVTLFIKNSKNLSIKSYQNQTSELMKIQ